MIANIMGTGKENINFMKLSDIVFRIMDAVLAHPVTVQAVQFIAVEHPDMADRALHIRLNRERRVIAPLARYHRIVNNHQPFSLLICQ